MSPQSSRDGAHAHSQSIGSVGSVKRPSSSHSRGASLNRGLSRSSSGSAALHGRQTSQVAPESTARAGEGDDAADTPLSEHIDLDSVDEEAGEGQEASHSDFAYAQIDPLGEDAAKEARRQAAADAAEKARLESMTQTRFTHVATPDGHMIVTGRQKELTKCEEEVSRTMEDIVPSAIWCLHAEAY